MTKAKLARLEDFLFLRNQGASVREAASRVGVSERTGWRYHRHYAEEVQLRQS